MKMTISALLMLISTSVFAADTTCTQPIYSYSQNQYEVESLLQMASVARPTDALKIYSVIGMLDQSERNQLAVIMQNEQKARRNTAICWTF